MIAKWRKEKELRFQRKLSNCHGHLQHKPRNKLTQNIQRNNIELEVMYQLSPKNILTEGFPAMSTWLVKLIVLASMASIGLNLPENGGFPLEFSWQIDGWSSNQSCHNSEVYVRMKEQEGERSVDIRYWQISQNGLFLWQKLGRIQKELR